MGYRDLLDNVIGSTTIAAASKSATTNGTGVSSKACAETIHVVHIGAVADDGTNYWKLELEESDALGSGYAVCTDANDFLLKINDTITAFETPALGVAKVLDAATDGLKTYAISYRGSKAYSRVTLTKVSSGAALVASASAFRTQPQNVGATGVLPGAL